MGKIVRATSLHTHSRYCDGAGDIEDYIRAALDAGLPAFGASAHMPVPWPNDYAMPLDALPAYAQDVRALREKYRGQIEVYLGLELDYRPGIEGFAAQHLAPLAPDYLIGSVHYIGELDGEPWSFEHSAETFADGFARLYHGDARRLAEDYYALVRQAARVPGVVIVGHIDRIKMYNADDRFFDDDDAWYRDLVDATLADLAGRGVTVELNTAGWRRDCRSPFPAPWIVRRCAERGIPMTLSADAHTPEQIDFRFAEGADVLRAAGHTHIAVLRNGAWTYESLE
ncbi:MAG: histidinol-phosphatase [Anaerolineae bacterium]